MRRIVFIIPLIAIIGLCGCKTTHSSVVESSFIRDSVNIRDSVRIKDSLRIKDSISVSHQIRDSLRIKDSTVIVKDKEGNVISKETWHDRDHYHAQSDSVRIWKAMFQNMYEFHKEDLQTIEELQKMKKEKEVIVKKPTLWEKLKYSLYGIIGTAVLAVALYIYCRKKQIAKRLL